MEKKHRDIVVDGKQYGWIANYQGKEIIVKVYKDKKGYFNKSVRMSEITPADVAEFIKEYNNNLAHIELGETLDKEWTAFLVSLGGLLISVAGVFLAFLVTGNEILTAVEIFGLLPWLLLVASACFAFGFLYTSKWTFSVPLLKPQLISNG